MDIRLFWVLIGCQQSIWVLEVHLHRHQIRALVDQAFLPITIHYPSRAIDR